MNNENPLGKPPDFFDESGTEINPVAPASQPVSGNGQINTDSFQRPPRLLLTHPLWKRPFAWWASAFAAGVVLGAAFQLPMSACLAFAAAGFVFGIVLRGRNSSRESAGELIKREASVAAKKRWSISRLPGVFTVMLALSPWIFSGAALFDRASRNYSSNSLSKLDSLTAPFIFRGRIIDADRPLTLREREHRRISRRMVVDISSLDEESARGRLLVYLSASDRDRAAHELRAGDEIEGTAEAISRIPEPLGEMFFDSRSFYARRGIFHRIRMQGSHLRLLERYSGWNPAIRLRRLRDNLAMKASETMRPGDSSLFEAVILGYKGDLDASVRRTFRQTGVAHLLAVSGLHLHLFALTLWLIGAYFGITRRRLAGIVLAISFAYALLTGFNPPMARAFVMLAVYLVGLLLWREPDAANTLGLAALALLIFRPARLFDAGFQLSFAAVAGILFLRPRWLALFFGVIHGRRRAYVPETAGIPLRLAHAAAHGLSASLGAWMATAPLVYFHFGTVSPLAPLSNLLVIPLVLVVQSAGILWLGAAIVFPGGPPGFLTVAASLSAWLLRTWVEVLGAIFYSRTGGGSASVLKAAAAALPLTIAAWPRLPLARFLSPGLQVAGATLVLGFSLGSTTPKTERVFVLDPDRRPCIARVSPDASSLVIAPGTLRQARTLEALLHGNGLKKIDTLALVEPRGYNAAAMLADGFRVRSAFLPPDKYGTIGRREMIEKLKREEVDFRLVPLGGRVFIDDTGFSKVKESDGEPDVRSKNSAGDNPPGVVSRKSTTWIFPGEKAAIVVIVRGRPEGNGGEESRGMSPLPRPRLEMEIRYSSRGRASYDLRWVHSNGSVIKVKKNPERENEWPPERLLVFPP